MKKWLWKFLIPLEIRFKHGSNWFQVYFVKTEKVDTDDYSLMFDSFLISVPGLEEDGKWNYDVIVYPKAEEFVYNLNQYL